MRDYVCVRVRNMKGVDVHTYDFDFDLTFAALLMHADGTIHRTYAGRDHSGSESHLSAASLQRALEDTRADHAAYVKDPRPPTPRAPQRVDRMPWMKARPKQPECYHCHNVNDARHGARRDAGTFRRTDAWLWPDPIQVGLSLERDAQERVTKVATGSAAARAGLAPGDLLVSLAGRRVRTFGDVQRVLDDADAQATEVPVTWTRAGKPMAATLQLAAAWKTPTPLVFAWRPSKWQMKPQPGFGGRPLDAQQKQALGIDPATFAFRIGYLVTWGENAATGRNARKAGLRKGDVILSLAGKNDFRSMDHYHAWFRFTRKPGSRVPVVRLRDGKRTTVELPVLE